MLIHEKILVNINLKLIQVPILTHYICVFNQNKQLHIILLQQVCTYYFDEFSDECCCRIFVDELWGQEVSIVIFMSLFWSILLSEERFLTHFFQLFQSIYKQIKQVLISYDIFLCTYISSLCLFVNLLIHFFFECFQIYIYFFSVKIIIKQIKLIYLVTLFATGVTCIFSTFREYTIKLNNQLNSQSWILITHAFKTFI
eukprot:TRINITY_DN2719_c0_g2_i3.p1 TRINITY_DN2719_c0_g2~~TRINITY_DN2719_c0_g2_i3.p1  ORF type:complete len:199 (+),score=-26.37 TRINITY_DN2719_c0_g2_i3:150-746(+)